MVVLGVEKALLVVRSGGDLGRDLLAERLLVGCAAGLHQRLLLFVHIVQARAILRAAVIALAHALRGVV